MLWLKRADTVAGPRAREPDGRRVDDAHARPARGKGAAAPRAQRDRPARGQPAPHAQGQEGAPTRSGPSWSKACTCISTDSRKKNSPSSTICWAACWRMERAMLKRNRRLRRSRHDGRWRLLLVGLRQGRGRTAAAAGSERDHARAARDRDHRPAARAAPRRIASPKCGRRSPASCRSACSPKAARSRRASSCSRSTPAAIAPRCRSAAGGAASAPRRRPSRAKLLEERYAPLIAANAVSQQENDEAIAARARAEADVAAARAAVDSRAHQRRVHAGAVADHRPDRPRAGHRRRAGHVAGSRAPLATVQQLDPIYVDITQSRTEMLRLQRQLASGELVKDRQERGRGQPDARGRQRVRRARPAQGFRSVGRSEHGLGAAARGVPESAARAAARHVRARAAHARHALGGAAGAAARRHRTTRAAKPPCWSSTRTTRWPSAWSPRIAPSTANG